MERNVKPVDTYDSDLSDTGVRRRMSEPQPCRVLIVDDDELVRARLAALLRSSNTEVRVAASGAEALRIMAETHCHVLITDWQMPDMDGLTLCRSVRLNQGASYIYVIMLTVRNGAADQVMGLAAGVDDYILKAAPIEVLLARLEVARRITHVEVSLREANRGHRELAGTDELTGAHNLRYFVKHLPQELVRAQRNEHTLAVLSCELDYFKQLNDNYGHEAGNDVLKAFVARAESCIRKSSDWIARMGGDEFMIVLPNTGLAGAKAVAQKLNLACSASAAETHPGLAAFTVSIAVNAVEVSLDTQSMSGIEHLLRKADRSLQSAKKTHGGRASAVPAEISPRLRHVPAAAGITINAGWEKPKGPASSEAGFGLRASFFLRMTRDRAHFTKLSAALAEAGMDTAPIYKDLYERAHRLHGSAFIFEFAQVGAAAGALEQATLLALDPRHPDQEAQASIRDLLASLVERIGETHKSGRPC